MATNEIIEKNKSGDSSLHDWFSKSKSSDGKPGWVQLGGKYAGKPCAKQPGQTTKPKCGSSKMKRNLNKKEEDAAFRRKNKQDPNPNRKGKAINVKTESTQIHEGEKDACYHKVKSRYSVWPSAYASGALVKCRKVGAKNWGNKSKKEEFDMKVKGFQDFQSECWKTHKKVGMKMKGGKLVNDCRPKNEEIDRPYTGPDKKDRALIKKMDNPSYAKRLADYEKNMDPKKRQALKDKATKGMKFTHEETLNERQKDSDNQRLSQERGRSNYGKASIRNMRATGTGGNAADPAERLVAMDARHKAHKEKRGVKTKGVSEAKKCWPGYEKKGTQKLFGKTYNRCVKKEDLEYVREKAAAWTRKAGKNQSGGLNEKGRKSYERENPGSDLKAPSKKVGNPRRASFCARMKGMKAKLTSKKTASDPDSRINKSLRAWNC